MKHANWLNIATICLAMATVLTTAASAQLVANSAPTSDWPQFRGPARDGKAPATNLLTQWPEGGPKLLWSVAGVGQGFSHAAVANGLVYVTGLVGTEGLLHAYALDGTLKWEANYGPEYGQAHPGARSTPTVHDGLVYVVSGLGRLSCFGATEGKPVWSVNLFEKYEGKPIQWGFSDNVLIDGDNVLVSPCGKKAMMVALNRRTGVEVWASEPLARQSAFCPPVLIEHRKTRMILTVTDSAVVAFAPATGQVLWQHPYQNSNRKHCNTPIYHDGLVYVASGYGKGAIGLALAEDGRSVTQLWEQARQDPVHGQAVLVDGYVYASSHRSIGGQWSCLDLKTGELAWQAAGVGKGGSVILADGLLYCYSEDGTVGIMRPSFQRCQVISTFKVPQGDGSHWAHPVVAGGCLFIRHGNALMCYDISAPGPRQR